MYFVISMNLAKIEYKDVYASVFKLEKGTFSNFEASFLDLPILTENKKFKTELCRKRYVLLFSILVPHLDSNIPPNICYTSVGYEILRFSRTALDSYTFLTPKDRLLNKIGQ